MKTRLLALAVAAMLTGQAEAGPSSGSRAFVESSRRQDFTGQGTYHRIGLFREQRNALRSAENQSPEPRRTLWESFTRLFQSKSKIP